MNKKELIDRIFHETPMTKKEIDLLLTKILETIMIAVSNGEKVQLVGFGSFASSKRKTNVDSVLKQDSMSIKSCKSVIRFSPGKFFKEKVNVY